MWFWLAIVCGLASSLDKVLNRMALKNRGNVIAHSFLYMISLSLISLIFSFPTENIQFSTRMIILVLGGMFFWSIGTLSSFLTHPSVDVSLSMIISRSRMIWMIPLGVIFLGESTSFYSLLGILLIFAGLIILFVKSKLHHQRGVYILGIGSIFVAIGTIFNILLVRDYLTSPQTVFIAMFSQAVVFLFILIVRKNAISRCQEVLTRAWKIILSAAVIEAFAFIGINYTYTIGNASHITAVYLSMTVVTVWIGIFFLKEREYFWKKLIGSALVTIGIIILKLSS